jgi:ribonuclease P protein component
VKRRYRLRRRQDFDRAMHAPRLFAGRALIVFARPNQAGRLRVGVTVSRRLRGAVERNRLRRRLREAARTSLLAGGSDGPAGLAFDLVLVGRPGAAEMSLPVLEEEAGLALSRLARQAAQ